MTSRTIGLVTDSNSQISPDLVARYGVEVVPLTVVVDGTEHAEGVDLTADEFYARFDTGTPEVSTSQPSPGRFAEAYERLVERGVEEILSIHVTDACSGTLNSARIAAQSADVPVRLVDTGTASFGVSCCVWEAGVALEGGADIEEAATIAESTGGTVGNVFVVQALELARRGGRIDLDEREIEGIPVVTAKGGEIEVVGSAGTLDEAVEIMTEYGLAWGSSLRVAVGIADRAAVPMSDALVERFDAADEVTDRVTYRIGPSVGVHTGPGTAGAFFYPSG